MTGSISIPAAVLGGVRECHNGCEFADPNGLLIPAVALIAVALVVIYVTASQETENPYLRDPTQEGPEP